MSRPTVGSSSSKQTRLVQQRAGNLDAAHLPDREIADPILTAIGHRHAVQDLRDQFPGPLAGDAVQRSVIHQVLPHRNVDIERAGLKDDAELALALLPVRSQRHARRYGFDQTVLRRDA